MIINVDATVATLFADDTRSSAYASDYDQVERLINKTRTDIEDKVLISYNKQGDSYRSTTYTYDDFLRTLRGMSVLGSTGDDDEDTILFYVGQTESKIVHGLVNLAAFLAHAMAVSIKHDVCDEFNVDTTDYTSNLAISNACGQFGRTYQDEVCLTNATVCNVDVNMAITAATNPIGSTIPPFECRPKENAEDFTGYWDTELGLLKEENAFANRAGSIHNEGCCWWGRGVLFTRGTCKLGRANHFLGSQANGNGLSFPIDLCGNPEVICDGEYTRDLRWVVGLFEWADTVQPYQKTIETYQGLTEDWDYMKELNTFIEAGFEDSNRFIDVVGMALSSGCIESACLIVEEKVKQERRENFFDIVFNILKIPLLLDTTPSISPSLISLPTIHPNSSPISSSPTAISFTSSSPTAPILIEVAPFKDFDQSAVAEVGRKDMPTLLPTSENELTFNVADEKNRNSSSTFAAGAIALIFCGSILLGIILLLYYPLGGKQMIHLMMMNIYNDADDDDETVVPPPPPLRKHWVGADDTFDDDEYNYADDADETVVPPPPPLREHRAHRLS